MNQSVTLEAEIGMNGVLDLTEPKHLLAKLEHEFQALSADHCNSYAAINALRDAYHLCDWIWNDRLKHDSAMQTAIMGSVGKESAWKDWIESHFPDFLIVRELCNGSKHLARNRNAKVAATLQPGYGSPLSAYGGPLGYGVGGSFLQVDADRLVSVANLIERARNFWADLFQRFPQLS
jgi:hypothetical protein